MCRALVMVHNIHTRVEKKYSQLVVEVNGEQIESVGS